MYAYVGTKFHLCLDINSIEPTFKEALRSIECAITLLNLISRSLRELYSTLIVEFLLLYSVIKLVSHHLAPFASLL